MIELDLKRVQGDFTVQTNCTISSQVTGLFGPSGAGKSTLLNMIAGLATPDSGRLILDGEYLFDSSRNLNIPLHQRRIGMVFQDSRLFPHLNVMNNLKYGFKLLPIKERRLELHQIIDLLEISHLLDHKPNQLSGGEKQRVALGRALLTSPRLLLLDEPLASLDSRLKQQILPFLKRVKDELRIPMIYVSHAIDEILYLTSELAIMEEGKILALGQFSEIINDKRVLALAHSLGLENILHIQLLAKHVGNGYVSAKLGNQTLHIPLTHSAQQAYDHVTVSIAASNIAFAREKISGITIQNQLACKVSAIQQVGHRVLVTVSMEETQQQLIAEITAASLNEMQITLGSDLFCLIKTQSIHPLASHWSKIGSSIQPQ